MFTKAQKIILRDLDPTERARQRRVANKILTDAEWCQKMLGGTRTTTPHPPPPPPPPMPRQF